MKKHLDRVLILFASLFLVFLTVSCDELVSETTTCPGIYTMTTVQVLTANGHPVALDQWIVYDKNSGKQLNVCESDDCNSDNLAGNKETGTYLLIDDSLQGKISGKIDLVAEGTAGSIHFKEEFTVQDNGCNLVKTSGASTIYVE